MHLESCLNLQLLNCDFVTMMKYEIPCSVGLGYFVLSQERSSDSGTTREEIESKVFVGMLLVVTPFMKSKTI